MASPKQFPRRSDDPQSVALQALDGKSDRPDRRSSGSGGGRPYRIGVRPEGCGERTWRLVRLFIETGESHNRYRVVYDQALAQMLGPLIKSDPPVVKFIHEYGPDWADDILARMIRIYWRDYVSAGMSNSQILRGYLSDHWADLFELAKTQYATDEFKRLEAAGNLHVRPHQGFEASMQFDEQYQQAVADIRVRAGLQKDLADEQLETLESGNDDPES